MKSVTFAGKIAWDRSCVDGEKWLWVSSASLGKFKIWTDKPYDIQSPAKNSQREQNVWAYGV